MTPSQFQAMEDVARTGDPYARVFGQAMHGGWSGVMRVIEFKEKWIQHNGKKWVLTPAGKKALAEARRKMK